MAEVEHPHTDPPPPLDSRRVDEDYRIASISSSGSQRNDSAIGVSPTSLLSYTAFETHVIYPPLITGHGRLVRGRQTVPSWIGVLVVVGVFVWTVLCALYVFPLLGGHRKGGRGSGVDW